MNYLQKHGDDLRRRLVSLAHFDTTTENDELVTLLTMETFREHICHLFGKEGRNPHFHSWWGREMAFEICIRLIKGSHMFHRYDHTNNTRWGVIYIAHKNQLPVEVIQQFQRGNCVVNK